MRMQKEIAKLQADARDVQWPKVQSGSFANYRVRLREILSANGLPDRIDYDEETGAFFWEERSATAIGGFACQAMMTFDIFPNQDLALQIELLKAQRDKFRLECFRLYEMYRREKEAKEA
jgi:hypothetical protein